MAKTIGCVSFVVAMLLTVLWIRSIETYDSIIYYTDDYPLPIPLFGLRSRCSSVGLFVVRTSIFPPVSKFIQGSVEWERYSRSGHVTPEEFYRYHYRHSVITTVLGFAFGVNEELFGVDHGATFVVIPYCLLIIALLILSALLFWPRSKPKSNFDTTPAPT